MADERRYQDEEVQAIFAAAAEVPAQSGDREVAPSPGLTLSDLRAIGAEVGIPAERIDAAARALERPGARVVPRRRFLGTPVSVGRVVDLPRAPTDREWGILLSELRQTFRARGRTETHGELREWTNGNLHAFLEPTDSGYRLRLGSTKGDALGLMALGTGMLGFGLVLGASMLLLGQVHDGLIAPGVLTGMGGAAYGGGVARLSTWARKRERQMEHIAARAQALLAGPRLTGAD